MLFRELLRQLAAGRPVSPISLAKALEWPTTTVVETLAKARGVEYDAQGSIVGYGLTLKETPHALEVNGQSLFTWCALDTLFFPAPARDARARQLTLRRHWRAREYRGVAS